MDQQKTDLRVVRTKKNIYTALIKLLKKKDFNDITVTELAREAMIDRKTFYLHYKTIYDVIIEYEADVSRQLLEVLEQSRQPLDMESIFQCFTDIVSNNMDFYLLIVSRTNYYFFQDQCKDILKDAIRKSYESTTRLTPEEFEHAIEYLASGIIGVYTNYLTMTKTPDWDHLAKLAYPIIKYDWERIT